MGEIEDGPEIIGRYELLTRLATGGMAELFLARERGLAGLERLVVVKRILPHLADQPSFVEMFLREARIVARLSHPNVVQIYELGQESESYHIAMEYIHGSTVRELLLLAQKSDRPMPTDVVVAVAEQACRGLHAAHELCDLDGKPLGLVHRDVSPHNLMCTTDGHVKLLDFGVAKSTSASVEATYSGNLKGKFAYLSPEQCRHEPLDRRSDVFAMGIVMWEMLTMRRLFKRETELEMMQSIIGGDVTPPTKYCEELPEAIEAVVLKALETDRDDRFSTAEQMRRALVAATESAGIEFGEDRVASFLSQVAGDRLAERQQTVEDACERELTVSERRRLLHMTGTSSRASQTGDAAGVGDFESTRDAVPEQLQKLVEADRERNRKRREESSFGSGGQTTVERPGGTATEPAGDGKEDEEKTVMVAIGGRKTRLVAAAVITVVVGGVLAMVAGIGDDPEDVGDGTDGGVVAVEEEADREASGNEADRDEQAEGLVELDEDERDVEVSGEPLALGWAPTIDPEVLRQEVEPLHVFLEQETGRPVPLVIADDYSDLSKMLRDGEVVAAMLPPTLYVLTTNRDADVEILTMREFDGTASSDGHLVTRRGSGYQQLGDLEGERFCFVDRASTSGHLLPRQYIRRQGFDPDEFVGEVHWSGDHFQGMRDLIAGECEAAAVYSGAYLSADQYGVPTAQVSTLALTGHLPQDVIAVGGEMSEEVRQLLSEALLSFDPQREFEVDRLGANQRITGFLERDDSDFEQLRDVVAEEGLAIDDIECGDGVSVVEKMDRDAGPVFERAPVRIDDAKSVGTGKEGGVSRALVVDGFEGQTVSAGVGASGEIGTASRRSPGRTAQCRPGARQRGFGGIGSLGDGESGTDEEMKSDETRCRVARESDKGDGLRLGVGDAEGEGFSRFDADFPEGHSV